MSAVSGPDTDHANKRYYLAIWQEMLREFLGWSESRVLEWARETGKLDYLSDPEDIFYHETPQYWVKRLLVPDALRAALSNPELIDLEARLLGAFADEHHFAFPLETDWRPYRAKVERILAEYGEGLPTSGRW
jgi:hypothetical protein